MKMMNLFLSPDAAAGSASGAATGATSPAGAASAASGATSSALTAVAASPAASAVSAPASNAGTPASWTEGFSEDLKGYVGNKGWKSPSDVVDSYRGAEKLIGAPQDRVLKLPEKFYDDAGKLTAEGRAVREKIGAPKDAKDYNLLSPKEGGDPKLLEHFRGVFHELGLPKGDAEKITGSWNQYMESQSAAAKEARAQVVKDQDAQLAKDWGAAHEQNINIAKEAIRTMGLKTEQVTALEAALGRDNAAKLLHKFGTQVREAPYIGGSRPDEIATPLNAKNQINELKTDKSFGKLLESGDRDAKAKWDRLHQQAYPGDYRV